MVAFAFPPIVDRCILKQKMEYASSDTITPAINKAPYQIKVLCLF